MLFSYKKFLHVVVCVFLVSSLISCTTSSDISSNYSINSHWQQAKELQAAGRYEIAKEYLLLALSAAQTVEEQKWLERELFAVDLQIKSKR